jgi:hypothetical protein
LTPAKASPNAFTNDWKKLNRFSPAIQEANNLV